MPIVCDCNARSLNKTAALIREIWTTFPFLRDFMRFDIGAPDTRIIFDLPRHGVRDRGWPRKCLYVFRCEASPE